MLDLSIIILSFNTRKLTLECINSLVKNSENIKYEIIVVDNASSDGSLKEIKKLAKKYPIVLVKNKENLGFAKANNIGPKSHKYKKERLAFVLKAESKKSKVTKRAVGMKLSA